MKRLAGKVAIVTGGASGLGRATVMRFLADGAKVVVADLNEASGAETLAVAKAGGHGDNVAFVRCDVAKEADVAATVAAAETRFGRLDIAYLNAGVGGAFGPIAETSVEDWDYTFAVLTRSVFLGMKHASQAMKTHGQGGVILVTASIAGMVGGGGSHAYSAAKAAVISLIENVAAELGPDRIRVVGIAPGVISTPLVHRGRPEKYEKQFGAAAVARPRRARPYRRRGGLPVLRRRALHHRRDDQGRWRPPGAGHRAVGHRQGQHLHEKRGRQPRLDRRSHGRAQPSNRGSEEMSEAERLHRHLIGQQGSRRSLNTPALVLDLEMLDRNIAEMAAFAKAHNMKLRPHSKTHKSADIARRQIAAGALGVCCAKLGEAEALGEAGIDGLHITSPVVTPQAIARLIELNGKVKGLMVVVDHPANVEALAAAAAKAGQPLTVIVDIDPGIHRTGVASPEAAVELAQKVVTLKSLKYAGVQFYCGRHQHIVDFAQRKAEIEERTEYLKGILAKLEAAGLKPAIITGAGTGTHYIDAKLGVFTELQVGSYVFMDHDYNVCDLRGEDRPTFEQALQIDARVVSANTAGMVTVDAGLKAMATEKGPPMILKGAVPGATTRFMGDEHLAVIAPEGKDAPALAEQVILVPPHCDPTVNLYESYHVVKGDTLVEIWPVTGRGRSR